MQRRFPFTSLVYICPSPKKTTRLTTFMLVTASHFLFVDVISTVTFFDMLLPLCLHNFWHCVIYFLITFYKLLTRYSNNCHTEAAFNLIQFITKTQTVTLPVRRRRTPERCRRLKCRWRGYWSIPYRWHSDQQWYFDTFFLQRPLWFHQAQATSQLSDGLNWHRMTSCTQICV